MASNSNPIVRRIARRFTLDEQVRSVFGEHDWATVEFVSEITSHKKLANSMLLDPSCADVFENCPLSASTTHLKSSEVPGAALSVRNASLQPEARKNSKVLHRIQFPNSKYEDDVVETTARCSNVVITVSEYSVPIAYKLIGEIPNATDTEYAVRIIWEKHCCAQALGTIVAHKDNLKQSDLAFINIVQKLEGKKAEKQGDPLPIIFALSSFIMSSRDSRSGSIPDDIRAFLTCDEMGIDVEVINTVENTFANSVSTNVLHQDNVVCQKVTEEHLSDALKSAFACLGEHETNDSLSISVRNVKPKTKMKTTEAAPIPESVPMWELSVEEQTRKANLVVCVTRQRRTGDEKTGTLPDCVRVVFFVLEESQDSARINSSSSSSSSSSNKNKHIAEVTFVVEARRPMVRYDLEIGSETGKPEEEKVYLVRESLRNVRGTIERCASLAGLYVKIGKVTQSCFCTHVYTSLLHAFDQVSQTNEAENNIENRLESEESDDDMPPLIESDT